MKPLRILLAATLFANAVPGLAADDDIEDRMLGYLLSLARIFTRTAAESGDADSMKRNLDAILSGSNAQANRAAAGLLESIAADLPPGAKETIGAIGRDVVAIARRERARAPEGEAGTDRALQARRDLTSIGLAYHDIAQFHDAVRRGDRLAVELFIAGRGVNLSARDPVGRTAADLARAAGDDRMIELLKRAQ